MNRLTGGITAFALLERKAYRKDQQSAQDYGSYCFKTFHHRDIITWKKTGKGVVFEMIRQGTNPAAILCVEAEAIMALGPIIGKRVYNREMPIRTVSADVLSQIQSGDRIVFTEDAILINE